MGKYSIKYKEDFRDGYLLPYYIYFCGFRFELEFLRWIYLGIFSDANRQKAIEKMPYHAIISLMLCQDMYPGIKEVYYETY